MPSMDTFSSGCLCHLFHNPCEDHKDPPHHLHLHKKQNKFNQSSSLMQVHLWYRHTDQYWVKAQCWTVSFFKCFFPKVTFIFPQIHTLGTICREFLIYLADHFIQIKVYITLVEFRNKNNAVMYVRRSVMFG